MTAGIDAEGANGERIGSACGSVQSFYPISARSLARTSASSVGLTRPLRLAFRARQS